MKCCKLRGILVTNLRIKGMDYYDCLEDLQDLVGGHIEYLQLKKGLYMIVNEEGKIHKLPINQTATRIANSFGIRDFIVGNALIVASRGENNANITYNQFEDICRRAEA